MAERRRLYLDLVGGAAGDMILAALLDLGAPLARVREALDAVGLADVSLATREVAPAGLRALRLDVTVRGTPADSGPPPTATDGDHHPHDHDHDHHDHAHDHHHPHDHAHHDHAHRPYRVIAQTLRDARPLGERTRAIALDAFRRLAEAEGAVHGVPPDEVWFHEVGSDDAIADIVGTAAAIEALGIDELRASAVPLGRGLTRGAHGPVPLPGPATLHLLAAVHAPLAETPLRGETVTPTGAALIAALVSDFGPIPAMSLERIGAGAGHKDWPDRPNIVRALLGTCAPLPQPSGEDVVLESNIDDMSPAHLAALTKALFAAGAADVWSTPIQMKKGRLASQVSALSSESSLMAVAAAFTAHSTTLGIRVSRVQRIRTDRRIETVETPYGQVRVKIGDRPSGPPLVMPEFDDCERLAESAGVPVRAVFEAAQRAAWSGRP
jgi:uncharacterized protein (TIGR00299 family) protein